MTAAMHAYLASYRRVVLRASPHRKMTGCMRRIASRFLMRTRCDSSCEKSTQAPCRRDARRLLRPQRDGSLGDAAGMLGGDACEAAAASCIDAGEFARISVRIEAALVVAADVEPFDDRAVLAQRTAVGVGHDAVDGHEE